MITLLDRLVAVYHNWRMGQAAKEIEDSTGVQLKSVELQENGWRMDLIAPNLLPLLDEAAGMLIAQSAENYIEFDMLPTLRRTDGKPVRVTIQWANKQSPAQMNAHLREENAGLRMALQAILVYDTEHNGQLSPVAALARDGLGLPPIEPPPIDQAMAELREKFGHHFDGVDAEQFVREQRDV